MRRTFVVFITVGLLATACARRDEPTAIPEPSTTPTNTTVAPTSTEPPATTILPTSTTTTTVARPAALWTVEALGRNPSQSPGTSGAAGSGCSPGTDQLPDGVWFGWVTDFAEDRIEFDLACLWSGRLEPAVSNDAARIRTLPVAAEGLIYLQQSDPVSYTEWSTQETAAADAALNAPGLPDTKPFWVFVNSGVASEIAEYPNPIVWSRARSSVWPDLIPGCCDGGTVAPASPASPWPEKGWPVDGFYSAFPDEEAETHYELTIAKFLSCREHPGECPEWWTGNEVFGDPDLPTLQRTLPFDRDLTVVILPIFDDSPIVGSGAAYADLRTDLNDAIDEWGTDELLVWSDDLKNIASDPRFPFGIAEWPGEGSDPFGGPIGYRGPGGSHLTLDYWWHVLEIRDGQPVLYVNAGLVAG